MEKEQKKRQKEMEVFKKQVVEEQSKRMEKTLKDLEKKIQMEN